MFRLRGVQSGITGINLTTRKKTRGDVTSSICRKIWQRHCHIAKLTVYLTGLRGDLQNLGAHQHTLLGKYWFKNSMKMETKNVTICPRTTCRTELYIYLALKTQTL